MTQPASDRIRTLLLRADNVLKQSRPPDDADRVRRARQALEEARELAAGQGVDERVRDLFERRLESLDSLEG